jgi:hypothetical protein
MENAYQDIKADMEGRISSIRLRILDMEARLDAMKEELSALESAVGDIVPEEPVSDEIALEDPVSGDIVQEDPASGDIVPEESASDEIVQEAPAADGIAPEAPAAVHDLLRMSAIKDVYARKEAWRTDMPGAPLDDIWNALSLNDRALFTNSLFREDPGLFADTVGILDSMDTLDEAVEYLSHEFPEWDMDSDLVYRFMMELRRKLK